MILNMRSLYNDMKETSIAIKDDGLIGDFEGVDEKERV